jgi:hypothetical protein
MPNSHDSPATGVRSAELYVLHPGARREVAPTPLTRRLCEEAAPIALPAPGALSALVTVRHLDLAPVVPSNQATPVFCHDAFLPGSRLSLMSGGVQTGVCRARPTPRYSARKRPKFPKRDARIQTGPQPLEKRRLGRAQAGQT